jgi:hypothetical protein
MSGDTSYLDAALSEARADVKGEIARTDTKASLLIAFNGASLAGLMAAAPHLPINRVAVVAGGAGAVLLVVSAGLLLAVIRPRLRPCAPGSFPHLASLTPERVRATLARDVRAENIAVLSRLAVAKYTRLQWAVDCTRLASLLLALAALATRIGGAS